MFYTLRKGEAGYRLHMSPWDTDLSWGVLWDAGFVYDYQECMDTSAFRIEFETMLRHYPDLKYRLARRWQELRTDVLSVENVLATLHTAEGQMTRCGVLERDLLLWGQYYQGEDTAARLAQFLEERLLWLDAYYNPYLQ